MKAEEMFEELGYKVTDFGDGYITYEQEDDKDYPIVIKFDDVGTFVAYRKHIKEVVYLSCEELKAINKQAEELGWNDETN